MLFLFFREYANQLQSRLKQFAESIEKDEEQRSRYKMDNKDVSNEWKVSSEPKYLYQELQGVLKALSFILKNYLWDV